MDIGGHSDESLAPFAAERMDETLRCIECYRLAVLNSQCISTDELHALRTACDSLSDACTTRLETAESLQQSHVEPIRLLQDPQGVDNAFVDFGNIEAEMVIRKRIDKGGCGVVYLGSLRGESVAVKTPSLNHYTYQGRREVAAEIDFLKNCPPHLNLVRGLGHGRWGDETALVLEQCEGDIQLDQLEVASFKVQIQAGLAHLHAHGWRNPDIKKGKKNNIMLQGTTVKLIDFGQAKRI